MGFGITGGTGGEISKTTRNTVEAAEKRNYVGEITDMETYGAVIEVTSEEYGDALTNAALNGQSGTTTVAVTTEHSFVESNTDYQRISKTTRQPGVTGIA
jgi:hypothetical protein